MTEYRCNAVQQSRHYYTLRWQTITIFSTRLWVAQDTDVDVWLEMLMLIE